MKVLLGVTGGIAAYKSAELVRALQTHAIDVQVAMTRSARRFVTPLTFAALTGHPVLTSLWNSASSPAETASPEASPYEIEHITAVQSIDAFAVVPATANTLARFAHGRADDFLSAAYLANTAPVLLAPAMNVNMWQHPATRANVDLLEQRGATIVPPDAGYLACGMTGAGRLASVEHITAQLLRLLHRRHSLASESILITAGGTREPIDPVRFLGNRSSGKMGHALAQAAAARGARVTLITTSGLPAPPSARVIRISTADEMSSAVLAELSAATVVIMSAAVADFQPRSKHHTKIRRSDGLSLDLVPTPDILQAVARQRLPGTLVIGFAAETPEAPQAMEEAARAKLLRKGIDAIVANDVSDASIGFEVDHNAGLFLTAAGSVTLPRASKRSIAESILDQLAALRHPAQIPAPALS